MLPNPFLRVKPPEMGCHDRECSLPDIVDQGDRSMAVAARDEQPSAGHTCYRRATPHAGKTAMFSPVLRTLVPCRTPVGPHVHSELPHWRGNRAPSPPRSRWTASPNAGRDRAATGRAVGPATLPAAT